MTNPPSDKLANITARIQNTPLASWLNFSVEENEEGLVYRLGFAEQHVGNPLLRALHGGGIAAFLEFAMQCELGAEVDSHAPLATASTSIDYLNSAKPQDMFAKARILKKGRRVAFMEATGWQASEDKPVATARACIRLGEEETS